MSHPFCRNPFHGYLVVLVDEFVAATRGRRRLLVVRFCQLDSDALAYTEFGCFCFHSDFFQARFLVLAVRLLTGSLFSSNGVRDG